MSVCIHMYAYTREQEALPVVRVWRVCVYVCVYCVHTQEQGVEHVCVCVHLFVCVCDGHTQEQHTVHECVCVHVFVCVCVYRVYTRAEAVHVCAGHPQELSFRSIHSAF